MNTLEVQYQWIPYDVVVDVNVSASEKKIGR